MDPTGPIRPSPPPQQAAGDTQPARWQVGQVLKAVALSNTLNGQTPLQIGRQQVQAQTPVPLQSGQQLSLQVQQLGQQPLLRIVSQLTSNPVADAIRATLPRQDSLAPLLANLSQLAANRNASVPPLIQQVSRNLVNQLPNPQQLGNPAGLRQAVQDSGVFLENRLSQGSQTPLNISSDFKANLLRLVQLVRNWPGTQPGRPATSPPAGNQPLPAPPGGGPGTPATGTPAPPAGTPLPTGAATPGQPGATAPPLPQGSPPQAQQPGAGTPRSDAPAPGTVARGLTASTPLPPGAGPSGPASGQGTSPSPAGTLATGNLALPGNPAAPPLRGQPPLPQNVAMAAATFQRLELTGMLRPEIQKQVEAALARVQLNQLASVPRDQDSGLEWLFELPVRRGNDTDVWAIRIRRDGGGQGRDREQPAHTWSVQLAFDLPGLGPVQARVSMQGEQVSTWFWAQRDETLPFLQEHLPELRKGFEEAGLEVGEMACHKGCIPAGAGAGDDPGLLSEKV